MSKRELLMQECEEVLYREDIGYLAMSDNGTPYCLPFNYVYHDGKIYIHSGLKGLKWEYLCSNPRVCFTVAAQGQKKTGESPCQYTYEFDSVVITGNAYQVDSPIEAEESLQKIIDKYRDGQVWPVPLDKQAKVKMLRINIEKITGRQNR